MHRLHNIIFLYILFLTLLLNSCATTGNEDNRIVDRQTQKMLMEINASGTYNVGQFGAQTILAIEIEVTGEGIRPLGSKIIRTPMKTNSALADLHLKAMAGSSVIAEYTLPDPRLVEINSRQHKILPKASTFIFVPLTRRLSKIRIDPVRGREKFVSRGGTINPIPLMKKACEKKQMYKECRAIWQLKAE